ncbi:MAG: indolepyruvate ferredoxin oxidoreductase subunit alpha, partial [Syntrophales bacterium LBB04]|nr:indolepyruvate ferredoxin oxidoreductase subunit alpha [Syntrophales bacterium LBB04]
GLFESGCSLMASYPGTPASEILSSVVTFSKESELPIHVEWSINEKAAFEVALAHTYTGKRAAVAMKQVGLNVAADPFTRSAYLGVKGGFVVISADDPGPYSSQTEQDSRLFAHFAKIPVFDPSSPREAKEMIGKAFDLSERYEIPVMVRPTTRVCHARQNVACQTPKGLGRRAHFEKNPSRWAATPQFIYDLHKLLNEKMDKVAEERALSPVSFASRPSRNKQCVIASGVAFAHTYELLEEMELIDRLDLFQVLLPYPLNRRFIEKVRSEYEQVLVVEETYPVIELQLGHGGIHGRKSGAIPRQGELTPDCIHEALQKFLGRRPRAKIVNGSSPARRPSLCPGCPHRPAFFAIKRTFPRGIFPSDIGCYTLGINLGAVDTCHCMGACISQGAGFYHSYAQDGETVPPIVVTIGDSTFFHAGIPGLINAVIQEARIIIVILDNSTTAMTGHQPAPHLGIKADGAPGPAVSIPDIVTASGVRFLRQCDPYDVPAFSSLLEEADRYCRSEAGGVAVILSKRSCPMDKRAAKPERLYTMDVDQQCDGCKICLKQFECPALEWVDAAKDGTVARGAKGRMKIDRALCVDCGACRHVCPKGAITVKEERVV